ncbi:MAG TPA: VTC domain-containing protein [Gammaproteobacteria bacterium]|nr:VTC domain-containing protein [Gammaproteobacteria bacterium]
MQTAKNEQAEPPVPRITESGNIRNAQSHRHQVTGQYTLPWLVQSFVPISLKQLNANASMLVRRDNKYVLSAADLKKAIGLFTKHFDVLTIDGKRDFTYETYYFDDDEYTCYHDHQRGRRQRFKARIRKYVDAQLCFLELKFKGKRGITDKRRTQHAVERYGVLDRAELDYINNTYFEFYGRELQHDLHPTIETHVQRTTLVAKDGGERMTIDFNMKFIRDELNFRVDSDLFIVETKSANANGIADKILRGLHLHPTDGCSKYCMAMAALQMVERHNNFLPALRKIQAVRDQGLLSENEHTQPEPRMRSVCKLSQRLLMIFAAVPLLLLGEDTQAMDFSLKARLDLDHALYREDATSLNDGGLTRRARLGVEAVQGDWRFEIEYDFTGDGEFKDAYVSYTGWDVGDLSVGQFKTFSGLEGETGSSNITFIERPMSTDAFSSSRRLGVGFARNRPSYTVSTIAYSGKIDGDDEKAGVGVRTTFAPLLKNKQEVVHLGGWASYENIDSPLKISARLEARPDDEKLLKTGNIKKVNAITRAGLETAWQKGSLLVQSEWMYLHLHRDSGKPNVTLDGGYIGASWLVTGEQRRYGDGRFKSVKPDRPTGAWELAARLSYIDLNDRDITGGRGHNFTLGVNWYIMENMRLMVNYIDVHSRKNGKSDNPDIVLTRLQVAF